MTTSPSSDEIKTAVINLVRDRDLQIITMKSVRQELELHLSLEPGSFFARRDEIKDIVTAAIQYLTSSDSPDITANSQPRPLLWLPGTVNIDDQTHSKIAFSAGDGALASFSLDFCLSVTEKKPLYLEDEKRPCKILSHCNGTKGFRIEVQEELITLVLVCDNAKTEVSTALDWEARLGNFFRISVMVRSSKEQQRAELHVDKTLRSERKVAQGNRYVECEHRFLLLGCPELGIELRDIQLFSGAVSLEDVESANCAEVTNQHVKSLTSSLWNDRSFTDCEILSDDGTRWPVHRSILGACSPVFRRMFETGMKESQPMPVIQIKDAASEDVEAFLHFLYDGELPDRETTHDTSTWLMSGALELADMYDVQDLVNLICARVEGSISPQNVGQVITFLKKRKATPAIGNALKRVRQQIHNDIDLVDSLIDNT